MLLVCIFSAALVPAIKDAQHNAHLNWFESWKRGDHRCPCNALMCDGVSPPCTEEEAYNAIVVRPQLFEPNPAKFTPYLICGAVLILLGWLALWLVLFVLAWLRDFWVN
jgi:hypothetical protein